MATKKPTQPQIKARPTERKMLLDHAALITSTDRNKDYGNPEDNFANIATYWTAYVKQSSGIEITFSAQDIAHMMILMKMARLATNPSHYDSLVDVAGYAACAADCRDDANPVNSN